MKTLRFSLFTLYVGKLVSLYVLLCSAVRIVGPCFVNAGSVHDIDCIYWEIKIKSLCYYLCKFEMNCTPKLAPASSLS